LHFSNLFTIVEQMSEQINLGGLELTVMLALLRLGEDAYGVPISREIERQTGREVALGSVYAALERLQGKGLVSSRLGEPTAARGGRAKRYFRATSQGLRETRETRHALMNLWRGVRGLQGEPT
jgi:PadR family transcriptional regulator, regulatory protein PadR